MINEFVENNYSIKNKEQITCTAPSNIALVKYWGKLDNQIPANPSLSFTLKHSKTITTIDFLPSDKNNQVLFEFYFEGERKQSFEGKLQQFFNRIVQYCPYLQFYTLKIDSKNTFPHSSGIASSASAMAALASIIVVLEEKIATTPKDKEFYQKKASFLARLGSGSACRSVNGNIVVWGKNKTFETASDFYGIVFPKEVHPIFQSYQDTILLVDQGVKSVSSSLGHQLMNKHAFAEQRFAQAHENIKKLSEVLVSGDIDKFIEIVESEALTLHAMMQTSIPYFILMKPNTLEIIQKIWKFREQTQLPICFTLDAGANVHLLYPEKHKESVQQFIEDELKMFCEQGNYIHDEMGIGAEVIES